MSQQVFKVVIETPLSSRVKYKATPDGTLTVDRILPPGLRFPFNFGYIPGTQAADGDPTDVILVLEEPLAPGSSIDCRLLGVIEAEQVENSASYRNDRLVGVSIKDSGAPASLDALPRDFLANVARFFSTYHAAEGNAFNVLGMKGPSEALKLVAETTRGQA